MKRFSMNAPFSTLFLVVALISVGSLEARPLAWTHSRPKKASFKTHKPLFKNLFKKRKKQQTARHTTSLREAPREQPYTRPSEPTSRFFANYSQQGSSSSRETFSTTSGKIETVHTSSLVTVDRYLNAQYLNSRLKGRLSGQGSRIIQAARDHGIDPAFFAATIAYETGWGTSSKVNTKNNPGGLTSNGRYMSFGSIEEGINAMAARLSSRFVGRGLMTVSTIGREYAPPGASNDPNGTNAQWPASVAKIMNSLIQGSVNY